MAVPYLNDWPSAIDLADRKVVGWSLSEDMTVENTVYSAWLNARKNRDTVDGFMFHRNAGPVWQRSPVCNL